MDQQVAYSPMGNRQGPFPEELPANVSPSQPLSGHGSPESAVPGNPGCTYKDLDGTNLWLKMAGTGTSGWKLVGSYTP
jgi:hypothetical protein